MPIVLMREQPKSFETFVVVWKIVNSIERKYYQNYQIPIEVIQDGIILRIDGYIPDKNFFKMKFVEMVFDAAKKGIINRDLLERVYLL